MTLQPSTPRYQPHSTPRSTWPPSAAAKVLLAYRATTVRCAESLAMFACDLGIDRLLPSLRNASATLESWLGDQRWPVRPLRIGIVSPGRWCEALFNQASPLPVEWYALARGSTPAAQASTSLDHVPESLLPETVPLEWLGATHALPRAESLRDLALDAVVESCAGGGLLIRTLEHSRLPAACADWSLERPVSFPTVFPCRLDVASLHWPEVRSDEWNLAHQMLIAAAAFSREPARVTLADMLDGRRAITERFDDAASCFDLELIDAQRSWTDAALDAVAESFAALTSTPAQVASGAPTPVRLAAARLAAAASTQTTWHTTDEIRLAAAKAAVQTLPNDATCLLQAAAAQIGCLHDDAGLATLRRAHEAVEALAAGGDIDNIAFLHAEANAGSQDSLTTGRLASGMCIALSHLSADRARFIIEDFLEELRDTGLLVGCDADLAVLRRAYATLTSNAAPAIQSHMFIMPPQAPEAAKPEVSRTRRRGSRRKAA